MGERCVCGPAEKGSGEAAHGAPRGLSSRKGERSSGPDHTQPSVYACVCRTGIGQYIKTNTSITLLLTFPILPKRT